MGQLSALIGGACSAGLLLQGLRSAAPVLPLTHVSSGYLTFDGRDIATRVGECTS